MNQLYSVRFIVSAERTSGDVVNQLYSVRFIVSAERTSGDLVNQLYSVCSLLFQLREHPGIW